MTNTDIPNTDIPNSETSKPKPPAPLATKIGLGLWALSIAWWFLYYAQYRGPFGLFGLKFACLTGATDECLFFQKQLAATSILPTYWPVFWYAGLAAMIVGFIQSRMAPKDMQ